MPMQGEEVPPREASLVALVTWCRDANPSYTVPECETPRSGSGRCLVSVQRVVQRVQYKCAHATFEGIDRGPKAVRTEHKRGSGQQPHYNTTRTRVQMLPILPSNWVRCTSDASSALRALHLASVEENSKFYGMFPGSFVWQVPARSQIRTTPSVQDQHNGPSRVTNPESGRFCTIHLFMLAWVVLCASSRESMCVTFRDSSQRILPAVCLPRIRANPIAYKEKAPVENIESGVPCLSRQRPG
jgi:hypothetical protein